MWKLAIAFSLVLAAFAPASQASSLEEDPFAFDAGFNGGVPFADRFGGNDTDARDQHGRKLLWLDNGDVVVAGLVPPVGATQNQANGSFNLGLVRYNAAGERVAWSNPTAAYSHPDKQYLVFPNSNGARYRGIADIKEHNGRIYVLVDTYESASANHVQALVFGSDGSFVTLIATENSALAKSGAGMVFYRDGAGGSDKLILVYTRYGADQIPSVRLTRFTLSSGSPFAQMDTAFGSNGFVDRAVGSCVNPADTPVDCETTARSVAASYGALGSPNSGAKPKIYIGGDYHRRYRNQDLYWDLMVMKVDVDGALQTDYGNAGIVGIAFDASTGTTQNDYARGLALETRQVQVGPLLLTKDYLYVAAAVDRKCYAGIGVAALDDGGQLRADFGDGGKRVFGGSNGGGPLCPAGTYADTPRALALNGDRLAIAGRSIDCPSFCVVGTVGDPMLAIVRASDGTLTEWRDHPVRDTHGTYVGDGEFHDVVPSADGTFTTTGSVRDSGPDHRHMLQTIRLRSDRIFGDGFE